MKQGFSIQAKNDTANIYLYGYIDSYEVSGQKLVEELTKLEGKYKTLNIYINSNGGDVGEGIAIFNILNRVTNQVNIYVDGIAASMAAVLLQVPNAKRYMAKHSKLMMHSVSGGTHGSADKLKEMADVMIAFEGSLVEMVAERTGISIEDVKGKWFDGKDHWFTAAQALEEKLIDGIVDGKVKEPAKTTNSLIDVIDFYDKQIVNYNSKTTEMEINKITAVLKLGEEASEEQVMEKVQGLVAQLTDLEAANVTLTETNTGLSAQILDLQTAIEAGKTEKITAMVDNAIATKKITADQKDNFVNLAKADFESTKKVLEGMKVYTSIKDRLIEENDNSPVKLTDEEKTYTFSQFQAKAGKKLAEIKAKMPEFYKELYKNAFGVEPKN